VGPKSNEVGADCDGATMILDPTDWVVMLFVPMGSIECGPVVG
jgi:hypothetical protein